MKQNTAPDRMKMNLAIIAGLMGAVAFAQGSSITWDSGTFDNLGPVSVLNVDNLVYAKNVGGPDLTVNVSGTPVLFGDGTAFGGPADPLEDIWIQNQAGVALTSDAYWTGGDANWDSINDTGIRRTQTGGASLHLSLQQLTIGQDYQLQIFASQDVNNGNRSSFYSDAATGGNISSELRMGDKDYVVGTFTADAITQDFYVQAGNIDIAYIDALALTVIPEPASVGLIGIGGLIMMLSRRRNNA